MEYERLGLGEIKSTKMFLQLTNHSTRLFRGMVEDVLIKVRKFIFLVDFVILETEVVMNPKNEIPVILGRPFFATSNALINYRDRKMKFTFRNMTKQLDVFNL